jgi:uncharacterized membrane protein
MTAARQFTDKLQPRRALPVLGMALVGIAAFVITAGLARNARLSARADDMAPDHASRTVPPNGAVQSGSTITINRTVDEVMAVWRDVGNLPHVLSHLKSAQAMEDGNWRLQFGEDAGGEAVIRITEDQDNHTLTWQSVDTALMGVAGRFEFRTAQGGRGTEVAATMALTPLGGPVGRTIARLYAAGPELQGRREMKRLKMFMETGEIATARFHTAAQQGEIGCAL